MRLAIVAACVVLLVGTIGGYLKARDDRVIEQHEVRVEKEAKKKDDRAQVARSAAVAKPDGMLLKNCRDCGKSGSVQIVEAGDSQPARPANAPDGGRNRGQ